MFGIKKYFRENLRGKKGQSGFTLIELLVVVTILGILAGIVTLSLVGLTTNASSKACMQEYRTVQAALDAYMANNNADSVTATGVAGTKDMSASGPVTLYNTTPPTYLRNSPTKWGYVWDSSGRITSIIAAPTGCAAVPSS